MKKFKCLTSIALSFATVLVGSNSCSAVWFPKYSEARDFLTREGISFTNISRDQIADIICGVQGHSSVIDFILRADTTKRKDVIVFVRKKLGCRDIDEDSIMQLISGAAEKFRKEHEKALDKVLRSKDAISRMGRAFAADERLDKEANIKKLFLYVVMLEKYDLHECNKDAAIKEINILLNNVLADIIAHDKSAKVAKESARKTDEMDGRMTFCEREVVAIRHGMEQLTARVDGHDEVLEDIQSRLDQLDKRMMDFERIENALFERVGEIATVMWNELSKTGKVDEKKFDELVSTLDHLTNELAANRDLGERFVELSSRVTKIGTYARVVSERMDTAVGRLDDVQSAVHRHSDRMQALERQRGEMQNALERVITDVRGVTGDYREYVDRCVKNQLEARKQKLRDVYDRAWWLQRSRMEDVHPDLFDGEEK